MRTAGKIALRSFTLIIALVLVIVVALLTVMWVLAKGPSPTAQRLFVTSVNETSAVYWLADIYLSEAEIESILGYTEPDFYDDNSPTDISLINIPQQAEPPVQAAPGSSEAQTSDGPGSSADDTGGAEDGDGIELVEVFGVGYRGYMLIVDDPLRVFVGTPSNYGGRGMKLIDLVESTGAVAGINAGGFYDPDGAGTGGTPEGIVITDGVMKWGADTGRQSVIGFDADGILHVGMMTPSEAVALGLHNAVSFGPTLISNGVAPSKESLRSGINPRTAIGQRADGAVLMLVVDGRQIDSMGATYWDLVEIFLDFGAVNAANLDGGSSTLMIIGGEEINTSASIAGPRFLPTAFLLRNR